MNALFAHWSKNVDYQRRICRCIHSFAKIDGEHFTAFIVDANAEGITLGDEEIKLGIKGKFNPSNIFRKR